MIKEQYVSFEVAKLLKEKGFKEETHGNYYLGGKFDGKFEESSKVNWNKFFKTPIAAPTQQMVMRWLREVHNIHISITFGWVSGYNAQVDWAEESEKGNDKPACCVWRTDMNTTYEVAVEAAIKYCLEEIVR
jgi:hypothetical protein